MAIIVTNTFAAACYEMNSIAELEQAIAGEADAADCAEWHLTPDQWRAEIQLALATKREDACPGERA